MLAGLMSGPVEAPVELPFSGVQMLDAYMNEVHLERRVWVDGDPLGPTLDVRVISQESVEAAPEVFVVILEGHVVAPFNDGTATAELRCSISGVFRAATLDPAVMGRFSAREAVVLIYPYLRASVGQVWRMTGIPMPPLPTLDTEMLLSVLEDLGTAPAPKAKVLPQAEEGEGLRLRACPSLTATLTATGNTPGTTWWTSWTRAAQGTDSECPETTPWTAVRRTFDPRVLGSNPSRLTTFCVQMANDT
jgi:preprotein translocase subunit SecB